MRIRVFVAVVLFVVATGAAQTPPPFATPKITDDVYAFRYGGHQAMFVVTPDGVVATDPIGHNRPQAVRTYIGEIRKISPLPINASAATTRRAAW